MTPLVQVIKVDFDNMENINPLTETLVGIFVDTNGLSARAIAEKHVSSTTKPIYSGWDNQQYPKYIFTEILPNAGIVL